MKIRNIIAPALVSIIISSTSSVFAMEIDSSDSSVNLVSTKVLADGTSSVTEIFTFNTLAGSVDDSGSASVTIDLGAIETGIDIRDERMGSVLFETDRYPEATITAQIPDSELTSGSHAIDLDITLDLHGKQMNYTVPVTISSDEAKVIVVANEPVLVDAASFDLQGGVGKLGELAGLLLIPTTVPVSFNLTFTR